MPSNRNTMIAYWLVVALLIVVPLLAVNALSIANFKARSYEVVEEEGMDVYDTSGSEGILNVVPLLCFVLIIGVVGLDILDKSLSERLASSGLEIEQPRTGVAAPYRTKYPRGIIAMYVMSALLFIVTIVNSNVVLESIESDNAAGVVVTHYGLPGVGILVLLISLAFIPAVIVQTSVFSGGWSKFVCGTAPKQAGGAEAE